jgi:two-component system nitrogen regulation sensor histidine kinase NtrY
MSQTISRVKTDRLVVVGILALIVVLTAVYAILRQSGDVSFPYVTNTVLLGFLGMADVVLILVLLVVLGRNLVKLVIERRREILGSRFRTKLVVTFTGLCLVPSLLLFVAALSLIQSSIERWFSSPVEEITANARAIVQTYYDEQRERDRRLAENLADFVARQRLLEDESQRRFLLRELESRLREYRLDYASVHDAGGASVSAVNPRLPFAELSAIPANLRERAMKGEPFEWIEDLGSGRLVRAGRPVRSSTGEILGIAVAGSFVGKDLTALTKRVGRAADNYTQIKAQRGAIRAVYILFFMLITLLVVFGSTWVGFYLARQITVPIQMLAEGTRAVAQGNLDYRVEGRPGDELGILVDSFNTMTTELQARRAQVERSADEIRRRNAELEDRRRYIETLLQSIPVGVLSFSAEGRVTTCNDAARWILRIDPGRDISGLTAEEVFAKDRLPEIGETVKACLASPRGSVQLEAHGAVEGDPVSLSVTAAPIGDGPKRGALVVLEDVTRLIKAQKMAAWREVARRIAHEIKNPLTPIQLSAQRILKKYREGGADFGQALEEGASTIVREVKTLKTLVDEFSGFARMPGVNPVPSDVHQIIDSALGLYQGAYSDVHFQREFEGTMPSARLDQEQMKRVFINLIDNALEAMGRRGSILIATRHLRDLQMMRIDVADDGPGIAAEDKEKLFLPYFSTKKRGTGLGLAIVNRIVSDHNGYIRVEDNRPRGTRFVIELPTAA